MATDRPRPPLFLFLLWIAAGAMLVPAVHALVSDDGVTAQAFVLAALMLGVGAGLVALALRGRPRPVSAREQLGTLLAAYTVLPLGLAWPLWAATETVTFFEAWFEMVSSLTTTGATLFDAPFSLSPSLHLWRALVGWLGGLMIWVTAVAIFAPLNLGGFEVRANIGRADTPINFSQVTKMAGPHERLGRYALRLAPIYAGLTVALWVLLVVSGQLPFVALCHAMSVMATSGISPVGGFSGAAGGIWAEAIVFGFLFFALSRLTFGRGLLGEERGALLTDPEFRFGVLVTGAAALFLFARHWLASAEGSEVSEAFAALWGGLFTVLSFLTTTGFESRYWLAATTWSGLETPGLVLLGLAIFGGGIGTTAGGVKLLRVYALYSHGKREIERLVHPSSIGGQGAMARRIRRQGARIAWVFFMLFAMSIAAVMALMSLTGVEFTPAMVLTLAALTNCGPLAAIGAEVPLSYAEITTAAQAILAGAMILGRLEFLAIIALLSFER